jgi:rare lipoprotein A
VTGSRNRQIDFHLVGLWVFCVWCFYLLSGCAARSTNRREPAAIQPSGDSSESNAPANRDATAEPAVNRPSSSSAAAKRDNASPILPGVGHPEEGNASWYGIPFHGRHASNGEVYDMHKLTAAHRTLPFDTKVRVTNLQNGKSTIVRITDRGPFVENRIIDLSMAAAREIDSIGPGVVPVRLEILSAVDPAAGFFTVQVGAFRDRNNAERLRERLSGFYWPIFIQNYDSPDGVFYRVRVGKVPGEDAARQFGEQLRSREGFTPFVVRLDQSTPSGGN